MRTLRTRLTMAMTAAMLLLLLVMGLLSYWVVHRALNEQFDESLMLACESLRMSTEMEGGDVEIEIGPDALTPTLFQFWLDDGEVLMRSQSLGNADLPRLLQGDDKVTLRDITLSDGRPGRAVGMRFIPPQDEWIGAPAEPLRLTLVVARDTVSLNHRLRGYAQFLVVAGAVVMLVTIVVARMIVQRGLSPVDAMAGQIAAVREDDLRTRVASKDIPGELVPMVDKLNAMLERLALAFERERSFSGNVAHELRTPLAGMRSTMEVALRDERSDEQYRAAMEQCLTIIERMQVMIETLVLLARLDAGQVQVQRETIAPADLVDACRRTISFAPDVSFDNRVPADLRCAADHDKLMMVLCNLLQNAADYVDAGGRIWAEAYVRGERVLLSICNTGCTLSSADARRVAEPFWRGDAARSATGVHAGLGLALVERLLAVQDAAISFRVSDGVFIACVALRLAD